MAASSDPNDPQIAVFLFGLKSTGKSCLLSILAGEGFPSDTTPTASHQDKDVPFNADGVRYNLKIVAPARLTCSGRSPASG